MTDPYDPRAAALDALAAMRWPDVSEPPAEQVEAVEMWLRGLHAMGAAGVMRHWDRPASIAWTAGATHAPITQPSGEDWNWSIGSGYSTRAGKPARLYATDGMPPWPLHGAVMTSSGWLNHMWRIDGICSAAGDTCSRDLMPLVPPA